MVYTHVPILLPACPGGLPCLATGPGGPHRQQRGGSLRGLQRLELLRQGDRVPSSEGQPKSGGHRDALLKESELGIGMDIDTVIDL